jgi:uncharacterized protein (TIGR02145 family)
MLTKTVDVEQDACVQTGPTFENFLPNSDAVAGNYWLLMDERDGKKYLVEKMADGRIWMVENLQFGDCTSISFHDDNSATDVAAEPTVAAGYVGHCRSGVASNTGYLYNWPAAMQHTNAYQSSSDHSFACTGTGSGTASPNPAFCKGICPTGWHVPTGGAGGEFAALAAVTSLNNPNRDWGFVPGGYCFYDGNIPEMLLEYAYYWSSTYNDNANAYILRMNSTNVDPIAHAGKDSGLSVRCVRNY